MGPSYLYNGNTWHLQNIVVIEMLEYYIHRIGLLVNWQDGTSELLVKLCSKLCPVNNTDNSDKTDNIVGLLSATYLAQVTGPSVTLFELPGVGVSTHNDWTNRYVCKNNTIPGCHNYVITTKSSCQQGPYHCIHNQHGIFEYDQVRRVDCIFYLVLTQESYCVILMSLLRCIQM